MLVSVMHSNNEVGSVQPIAEIVAVCRPRGIKVHADGAQSTGARAGAGATGIESMLCVRGGGAISGVRVNTSLPEDTAVCVIIHEPPRRVCG